MKYIWFDLGYTLVYMDREERLIALDRASVATNECIYDGDNYYDDVIGSRKVGMSSILINPFDKKGMEELEEVQVISNIKELLPTIESTLLSI